MQHLSSEDKVRLITHGEQPYYFMPVPNIGIEQHPMVSCVKDACEVNKLATGR